MIEIAGAANRTRTCDPVITNDVLYQLSYCGGPNAASGVSRQRPHLISGMAPIGKKNAVPTKRFQAKHGLGLDPWASSGSHQENASKQESRRLVAAPAGQKSSPAAGLGLGRADLFREFVRRAVVVDPGIVGRPDERNDRRNGGWNSLRNVLP